MTLEVERIFHFLNGGQKLFAWKDKTLMALELQKILYIESVDGKTFAYTEDEALNEALSENQKLLLDILRSTPKSTQKELIETTSLSRSTVQRVMKELIEKGYLERIGSKKSGSWIVKG